MSIKLKLSNLSSLLYFEQWIENKEFDKFLFSALQDPEDVSNFQLAWEMLELARVIIGKWVHFSSLIWTAKQKKCLI